MPRLMYVHGKYGYSTIDYPTVKREINEANHGCHRKVQRNSTSPKFLLTIPGLKTGQNRHI